MRAPRADPVVVLALLAPACLLDQDECRGGVDVEGDPSLFTVPAGPQAEGYEVAAPRVCDDGVTSIVVAGPSAAANQLADGDVGAFFDGVLAELEAEGATVYGPGMTLVECIGDPVGTSPYLYLLQIRDWGWADATVEALGTALVVGDLGDSIGVQVGLPIACAD